MIRASMFKAFALLILVLVGLYLGFGDEIRQMGRREEIDDCAVKLGRTSAAVSQCEKLAEQNML